jgi:type IV pilus assembly protein PilC
VSEPIIPSYENMPNQGRGRRRRGGRGTGQGANAPPDWARSKGNLAERVDPLRRSTFAWLRASFSWRIGPRALYFTALQLRAYIEAGFPIVEAFHLMARSSDHLRVRAICRAVHTDLRDGGSLRDALRRHEGPLPRHFIEMLAAGEKSGSYDRVLGTLESHNRWLMELAGEIKKVVAYPLFVMLAANGIMAVTRFILQGIEENSGNLGMPEDGLSSLGAWLWIFFAPVLYSIIGAYLLTTVMRESKRLRAPLDFLGLALPGIGRLVRRYAAANFCRMYATLIEAGHHPSNAYIDTARSMGNIPLERKILAWKRFVDDGEPVSEALRRSGVMPSDVLAIIDTSEYVASADTVLPRFADLLTDQIRMETKMLVKAITPLSPILIVVAFFMTGLFSFMIGNLFNPWNAVIFVLFFLLFLI